MQIFEVSELSSKISSVLAGNFSTIWVEGEISNVVKSQAGHIYFTLKDQMAQIRCAMFRSYAGGLSEVPAAGQHVIVQAQVSFYEPRGDLQLIVTHLEDMRKGMLQRKFEELKAKLAAEGLFATERKRPIPKIFPCLGIITSPTGAAIHDILTVFKDSPVALKIIIYPTQVQGDKAAGQIVKALETANLHNQCQLLILTRGGGSIEDLWPFNEEVVARAIYQSQIPVISAVGHEVDFTISDFVADFRAATPSNAAKTVYYNLLSQFEELYSLNNRLLQAMDNKIQRYKLILYTFVQQFQKARHYIKDSLSQCGQLMQRLELAMHHNLGTRKQGMATLIAKLNALNPLATLERGYAIVSKDNKVVSQVTEVVVADEIKVALQDGALLCNVTSIHKSSY
jgi:exodeoxyribonuclease VII large subunit